MLSETEMCICVCIVQKLASSSAIIMHGVCLSRLILRLSFLSMSVPYYIHVHLLHLLLVLPQAGQKINDLYEDFKDGTKLLLLLELLTETKLRRERGKMRVHKLQNVQYALDFLQKEKQASFE